MQSQTSKIVIAVMIAVAAVGGGAYFKTALAKQNLQFFVAAQITSPDLSKPIKSPLIVSGKVAKSFLFGGTFPVVLKDADGTELARVNARIDSATATQATVPSSAMLPFSARLTFTKPLSGTGQLILQSNNPLISPGSANSKIFKVIFSKIIPLKLPAKTLPAVIPDLGRIITTPNISPLWTTYRDYQTYHFQIKYPSNFSLNQSQNPNTVLSIQYPKSYTAGTNLQSAKVEVYVGGDPAECSVSGGDQSQLGTTMMIKGIRFYKYTWSEAAMGHTSDNISYNTVFERSEDEDCLKISLSMTATNMDMYSNGNGGYLPGSPKPYDRQKVVSIFEQIFSTFNFL